MTATDNAGNSVTDTLEITYSPITAVTPTPISTPTPTTSPSPSPQVSPSPVNEGIVFGIVKDESDNPLKDVTVTITGDTASQSTTTDGDGYYEFDGLAKGSYTLTYMKEDFEAQSLK